jgi:hypothetical protein
MVGKQGWRLVRNFMVISDGADEEGRTGAGRTHRDLAGRAAAVLGQGNVSSADDAETLILYVYIFISPETPAATLSIQVRKKRRGIDRAAVFRKISFFQKKE